MMIMFGPSSRNTICMNPKCSCPNFLEEGNVVKCSRCRGLRLLGDGMKEVDYALDGLWKILTVGAVQFGLISWNDRIDAVFVLRKLHEEHSVNGNVVACVLLSWENV